MYCLSCGRSRGPREWSCPCGCSIYGDTLTTQEAPERASGLVGILADLTRLPGGQTLLMMGPRGSGKSTLALQSLERPTVISTEMGADRIAAYAKRLGVRCARIGMAQLDAEGAWSWPYGFDGAGGIVVDSVTVQAPLELLRQAMRWGEESGLPVIAVSQVTTEGTARGGPELEHTAKAVVEVRPDGEGIQVSVLKSRFGPQTSRRYMLTERGLVPFVQNFYYTVTGKPPAYQLSPYPWTPSPVWSAVEEDKLRGAPEPPAAAAALPSKLYGAGWVEPPDVEQRRAFAEAHGVTWFSPQGGKDG